MDIANERDWGCGECRTLNGKVGTQRRCVPTVFCHKELLRGRSIFCPIENDLSVLDDGQSVRALIEHIATLQNFVIVDNGAICVAEVA
jgi:hypothetical protein